MFTTRRISLLSAMSLLTVVLGAECSPGQSAHPSFTIVAPRALSPLEEARMIEHDIEREFALKSVDRVVAIDHATFQPPALDVDVQETVRNARVGSSPADVNRSTLLRTPSSLRAFALIGGLQEGVYVMWWVVYNHPYECSHPIQPFDAQCGGANGSDAELEGTSIFWATGAVVKSDGYGLFHARTSMGTAPGRRGAQHVLGPGLTNPATSEVHLMIAYVGRAAGNVEDLSRQLYSIPEECRAGSATSFGIQPMSDRGCRIVRMAVYPASTH